MNHRLATIILTLFIVLLLGVMAAVGLGEEWNVQASSPIYVRKDGDDTICDGHHDAPATSAPDCAFASISRGLTVVDSGGVVIVAAGIYSAPLNVTKELTLQGAGVGSTIVDGGGTARVLSVNPNGAADVSNITLRNGHSTYGGGIHNMGALTLTRSAVFSNAVSFSGGGIFNANGATMVISDCIVSDNRSEEKGAGIFNFNSALTVVRSTMMSNIAALHGGGLESVGGTLTVDGSTIRKNRALGDYAVGGGLFNDSEATLSRVTIAENTSNDRGGGLFNQGPMTLTNVTISGNAAGGQGGGVLHSGAFTLTVVNCTVANNSILTGSGAGGIHLASPAFVENTLLADNDNGNCDIVDDNLISKGHNLDSGDTCDLSAAGDIAGTASLIGPLADNGGPSTGLEEATLTQALLGGSPAIDAGVCVPGVATDQRGVARPQGDDCDIGAYEFTGYHVFLPLVQRSQ